MRSVSELIGLVGVVTLRVPGGDRPGEVMLTVDGLREPHLAYAGRSLAEGEHALVVGVRGPLAVDVEPWTLDVTVASV
jgi:hypothetical protein